jgi:purine-nucleoside phosphorylase
MENKIYEMVNKAVEVIRKHTSSTPKIGIILGTGLGAFARQVEADCKIEYIEIPHFSPSTVDSHTGRLIFAKIDGKEIVMMEGRLHFYEGYSMHQITFPVRVMKALGVEKLLITNACGSLNPYFEKSNLMVIDDHINLLGTNPLIGPNDERLGLRFPDMSQPYSRELIDLAEETALKTNIKLYKGVYVSMPGPILETRAEYRFLRTIGADVVGMSTVPEVIVAVHSNMKVLGISVITDECYPDALEAVGIEKIIEAASVAEPKLTQLMTEIIKKI